MTTADTVYLTSVCVIIVIIYKCFLWRYFFVLQENGKSCENQLKGGVPSKFEKSDGCPPWILLTEKEHFGDNVSMYDASVAWKFVQHSPTPAALSTSYLLNHSPDSPVDWTHWLHDLESHTNSSVSMNCESKDWRNQTGGWIQAMY